MSRDRFALHTKEVGGIPVRHRPPIIEVIKAADQKFAADKLCDKWRIPLSNPAANR